MIGTKILSYILKLFNMKKSTQKTEIELEEKENKKQFDLAEKERKKKESKVVERGVTDGTHYIAFDENGNIPESNHTVVVDWKKYEKTSDGSINILD